MGPTKSGIHRGKTGSTEYTGTGLLLTVIYSIRLIGPWKGRGALWISDSTFELESNGNLAICVHVQSVCIATGTSALKDIGRCLLDDITSSRLYA